MPENDEVDAISSASKVVADGELYGSVEYLANTVQKTAGGDIFRIETVREYPSDHEELVDLADDELRSNERPELASSIENFDEYDTVFVGYPIWWGDMPMAVYSFFDEYDFSGKTIIPFSSHGGSRLSGTVDEIKNLEPDADVIEGYTVSREDVADDTEGAGEDIAEWVKSLGTA